LIAGFPTGRSSEQLAGLLSVPLFGSTFGGAVTGVGNQFNAGTETTLGGSFLPRMLSELAIFLLPAALIPGSLFLVWGDVDDFEVGVPASVAVADIDKLVASLQAEGAQTYFGSWTSRPGGDTSVHERSSGYAVQRGVQYGLQTTLPSDVAYFDMDELSRIMTPGQTTEATRLSTAETKQPRAPDLQVGEIGNPKQAFCLLLAFALAPGCKFPEM
jgi:hypothetical protein